MYHTKKKRSWPPKTPTMIIIKFRHVSPSSSNIIEEEFRPFCRRRGFFFPPLYLRQNVRTIAIRNDDSNIITLFINAKVDAGGRVR